MEFNEQIKKKLKNLPYSPGVYIMKNADEKIIYVGKSKVLKNRVSQYFQNTASHTPKTCAMVSHVNDFDYILTDTESEALALECTLIKKYRPRYNILLKDDKQYPYIKITMEEDFPRIMMTRRVTKDGALYFGPFMSGFAVRDTLEVLKKVFKIRSCKKNLPRDIGRTRPCLLYHIGECSAPCDGKVSKEEYREAFDKISSVLRGNSKEIISELEGKMYAASERMEYECAASYRDKIQNIKALGEKQKVSSAKGDSRDVLGVFALGNEACIQVFYIREGKLFGTEHFVFENNESTKEELTEGFIKQFYGSASYIPSEIVILTEIPEMGGVEGWLSSVCGHKVCLTVPKKGEKKKTLELACKNAEESYKIYKFKRDKEGADKNLILSQLKALLSLDTPPYRIESYDISNISGASSIGAQIVYVNAAPSRKNYRKYNIKTVEGADDYASMTEVIMRRFSESYKEEEKIALGELKKDKAKFLPRPDLILLDGGKGHISVIRELLADFNEDIPVFGLVKNDKHKMRAVTDGKTEIPIEGELLFNFLTGISEEVHRFAITTFRKKHEKGASKSVLENIPGIGPEKRRTLLKFFTGLEKIKKADVSELCRVIDKRSAQNVYDYFHGEKNK